LAREHDLSRNLIRIWVAGPTLVGQGMELRDLGVDVQERLGPRVLRKEHGA